MVKIIQFSYVFLFCVIYGCTPAIDLSSPERREEVSSVRIYEDTKNIIHTKVGVVEARYCGGNQLSLTKGGNITREGAVNELRYNATKLGANGVVNIICQTDGINWATNCNNSIRCIGDAIKVQ